MSNDLSVYVNISEFAVVIIRFVVSLEICFVNAVGFTCVSTVIISSLLCNFEIGTNRVNVAKDFVFRERRENKRTLFLNNSCPIGIKRGSRVE